LAAIILLSKLCDFSCNKIEELQQFIDESTNKFMSIVYMLSLPNGYIRIFGAEVLFFVIHVSPNSKLDLQRPENTALKRYL